MQYRSLIVCKVLARLATIISLKTALQLNFFFPNLLEPIIINVTDVYLFCFLRSKTLITNYPEARTDLATSPASQPANFSISFKTYFFNV